MTASLIAMMFVGIANTSESLLPKTPDDWRHERIEFPLTFAPKLAYQGFEELRFAPGMFNPESDTYFTYVFAIKLKGKHKIDAKFLKKFLYEYYLGLCKTVSKGEDWKLDFSKISAQVTTAVGARDASLNRFDATIHMFDTFVTGKPLTLHVELIASSTNPDDVACVFAMATPKPKDKPIWRLLRGIGKKFSCH